MNIPKFWPFRVRGFLSKAEENGKTVHREPQAKFELEFGRDILFLLRNLVNSSSIDHQSSSIAYQLDINYRPFHPPDFKGDFKDDFSLEKGVQKDLGHVVWSATRTHA